MPAEITAAEQLLEVVGQPHGVEFDYPASELLNPARVDVTMDVVLLVQKVKRFHDLAEDVEDLITRVVLLAQGLPLRHGIGRLHLDE